MNPNLLLMSGLLVFGQSVKKCVFSRIAAEKICRSVIASVVGSLWE